MNDTYAKMIAALQEEMKPLEEQIRPVTVQLDAKKKLINQLCLSAGEKPLYADVETDKAPTVGLGSIQSDQYFGKATATVVKDILERRKNSGLGAIALEDLYEAMKAGGFEFDSKDPETARRGVAITLGKNSAAFIKIPSTGAWGLSAWYPNAKRNKPAPTGAPATGSAAASPATTEGTDPECIADSDSDAPSAETTRAAK